MATAQSIKHPERRAFAISLAVHFALFLLLLYASHLNSGKTLQVALVIERDAPQRIESEDDDDIAPTRQKPARRDNRAQQKKKSPAAGEKTRRTQPAESSDQWSNYERQMHAMNRPRGDTAPATKRGTAWGNEKIGRNVKHGESEQITIPKGSSSVTTRWRKGAARRVISLPSIDYPESVRRKSGQGRVELQIEVNAQGRVESVEILKSSGHTRLDVNARNAYRNAVFSPSSSGESAVGIVVVTFKMKDN